MIRRALVERGHETTLLQPDLPPEEIVQAISSSGCEYVLVGRTLGYGVADVLARLADLADAAGVRSKVKMVVGGMAVRPEIAAETGFDAGFGPGTSIEEVIAYVEGRPVETSVGSVTRSKPDLTSGYTYSFKNREIEDTIRPVADEVVAWATTMTSPAVERARLRRRMAEASRSGDAGGTASLIKSYVALCDAGIAQSYDGGAVAKTRPITAEERDALARRVAQVSAQGGWKTIRHGKERPVVFIQYGTGCPIMDITHIQVGESWGADGVVHFDPSWAARKEGMLHGFLTHQEDGSLITEGNLNLIKSGMTPYTLWQVRAHRGLNTPETVVLAGEAGADLTKINMVYGSLGAGTDPERLTVDGVEAIRQAVHYGLPFDVVTNEELCGVPAHKAFAGMLIVASIARRLGGRPILQPLFCYSPQVMIEGQMKDNYVDFNAAKVMALRSIIDAPVWPGAPVGFLTHTEDRVQSSMTTALHACMASSMGVDAISIASSDEAYSGGPISAAARVDTLRAVREGFRFFGQAGVQPTPMAAEWASQLVEGIHDVLKKVRDRGSFVGALYDGLLGTREDGAYPGRSGRGTVRKANT
ncbi:MAG: cobalamin-binding protein [Firmicutes bacterium]|nr:cobalamin-binding protein [Bacillota bacterium]